MKGAARQNFRHPPMTSLVSEYIFSLSQSLFLQSLVPVRMKESLASRPRGPPFEYPPDHRERLNDLSETEIHQCQVSHSHFNPIELSPRPLLPLCQSSNKKRSPTSRYLRSISRTQWFQSAAYIKNFSTRPPPRQFHIHPGCTRDSRLFFGLLLCNFSSSFPLDNPMEIVVPPPSPN